MKLKKIFMSGISISLIGFINFVSAHTSGIDEPGYSRMMGGIGMWGLGWIFPILIIVALTLLIIWLFKQIKEKK